MNWRIGKALRVGMTGYALALSGELGGKPVDVVALVDVLSAHNPRKAELTVERVDGGDEFDQLSARVWLITEGELEALLACSVAAADARHREIDVAKQRSARLFRERVRRAERRSELEDLELDERTVARILAEERS